MKNLLTSTLLATVFVSITCYANATSTAMPHSAVQPEAKVQTVAIDPIAALASTQQVPLFEIQKSEATQTPTKVALVDSCADHWYYRSGWEELACGFSGQGWFN